MNRVIEVYGDYFWEFYDELPSVVKDKIDYVFEIIISTDRIPTRFLKHVDDGLYEIRIDRSGNIYRIFCFFDQGKMIILLHGFQKKTQKTPTREIKRAKRLRKMYYDEK